MKASLVVEGKGTAHVHVSLERVVFTNKKGRKVKQVYLSINGERVIVDVQYVRRSGDPAWECDVYDTDYGAQHAYPKCDCKIASEIPVEVLGKKVDL